MHAVAVAVEQVMIRPTVDLLAGGSPGVEAVAGGASPPREDRERLAVDPSAAPLAPQSTPKAAPAPSSKFARDAGLKAPPAPPSAVPLPASLPASSGGRSLGSSLQEVATVAAAADRSLGGAGGGGAAGAAGAPKGEAEGEPKGRSRDGSVAPAGEGGSEAASLGSSSRSRGSTIVVGSSSKGDRGGAKDGADRASRRPSVQVGKGGQGGSGKEKKAKGGSKGGKPGLHSNSPKVVSERPAERKISSKSLARNFNNPVKLFAHLPQPSATGTKELMDGLAEGLHVAIIRLGNAYAAQRIVGSAARCVAMLATFRRVVVDYSTPEGKPLSRDLLKVLQKSITFLNSCRTISVSMGNAIRYLKKEIANVPLDRSEDRAKADLVECIDVYIQERFVTADKILTEYAVSKIHDGDQVLTFGYSNVVFQVLCRAFQEQKEFHVVVVDCGPHHEGRTMLRRLLAKGIACTFVNISAVSHCMKDAQKVLLGAASVCANGTVISRAGSASVAMIANSFQVPVIVCCETQKFSEKVQLDSITSNELGGNIMAAGEAAEEAKGKGGGGRAAGGRAGGKPQLQQLNLMYDATPAEYVTLIATEVGMIPASSVPVVLREHRREEAFL